MANGQRRLAVSYLDGAPKFKTTAPPYLPSNPPRQWAGEDGKQLVTYLQEREEQQADEATAEHEVPVPADDEVEEVAAAYGLDREAVV